MFKYVRSRIVGVLADVRDQTMEDRLIARQAGPPLREVQGFAVTEEQWELLLAFGGSPDTAEILLS